MKKAPARPAPVAAVASKTAAPARKSGAVEDVEDDRAPVAAEAEIEEDEEEDDSPARPSGPIQISRAAAKAEVFQEGDHVVYPTHGVGKVERIATEEIAGHKLELSHITFEENRMTLRVPVAKARSAGLR
ncbi:MAG: CarD family transcriptional regulator, partial [Rhodospirillales bacterium]|nr:CarD family transcriptional regulator [Rhodospirillales bacterium]